MKICSLLPSGTEILFALGVGDKVAGVTDLCNYPPQVKTRHIVSRSLIHTANLSSAEVERRMQELLKAGRTPFSLDTVWLYSEKPDLILTQDTCYVCDVDGREVMKTCASLGLHSRVLLLSPRTLTDILDNIVMVGEAIGAREKAKELVKELQQRVKLVYHKVADALYRPRVLSLEGINPLVAGGHWLPEMKMLAGGLDGLFSSGCRARRLSWTEIVEYSPDVLVISLCSSSIKRSLKEVGWLASQEGWWCLPAVRTGCVYVVEDAYFSTPGPRIVQGLEMLAQILHPELFEGLIPPGTVVKLDPVSAKGCPPEEVAACFNPYP